MSEARRQAFWVGFDHGINLSPRLPQQLTRPPAAGFGQDSACHRGSRS